MDAFEEPGVCIIYHSADGSTLFICVFCDPVNLCLRHHLKMMFCGNMTAVLLM